MNEQGWNPHLLTFTVNIKLTLNYQHYTQISSKVSSHFQVGTKFLLVKMTAVPLLCTFEPLKEALDLYTDADLVKRYRLDCAGIDFVTDMVRRDLQDPLETLSEFGIKCLEVLPEDL